MNRVLSGLAPERVFSYFEEISRIPRASGHEEKIAAYLCAFAKEHHLYYRTDELYNVLIIKEASAGYEAEPAVMLQGHTDMVCQKRQGSSHDFSNDPLGLCVRDGWISADGTTLGADDGIAVAVMLAVLSDDTVMHPYLECLFTAQEETGLGGAAGFDYTGIRAKLLYNLDSEEEGVCTVSCAGGVHCDIRRRVTRSAETGKTVLVRVSGLRGGHSGAEIGMHRANAHRVAGQILSGLSEVCAFRIVSLAGGNMDNAIPRECAVKLIYKEEDDANVRDTLRRIADAQTAVFSEADRAEGKIAFAYGEGSMDAYSAEDTEAVIGLLTLPPDGVLSVCEDMPSLVEASDNLGILAEDEDGVTFGFLARSCVEERKEEIRRRLAFCARVCGAELLSAAGYPGWAYNKDSEAVRRYCAVYERQTGKKPRIEAIHAGLECGLIQSSVPGIDPISIGPDMVDIHTPEERIRIASVQSFYETVLLLLAEKGIRN